MANLITLVQTLISLLLSSAILVQSQGAGLSKAFGGASLHYHSKRGIEKLLFKITIILTVLFFVTSVASLLT